MASNSINPRWARVATLGVVIALAAGWAPPTGAQQWPTQLPPGMSPQQALEMIRQSPQLQAQLRDQVAASGLTPAEIRDRLQAAGYPPNMLDSYLFEATPASTLNLSMLRAIALLGVNAFQSAPESPAPQQPASDSAPPPVQLPLFGLEALRQPSTVFDPLVAGPVDGTYVLGPGDVMVLILTGAVQSAEILEVTREGFVLIPRVGQVFVNNVSLDQFRELMYDRLSRAYSGVSRSPDAKTRFDVTVARVRTQTVRVIGEVEKPGSYSVAATGGVLTALYQAGGLNASGNFRGVEIRRGAELVGTVDLYEYLRKGVVSNDIRLRAGDVVFVPLHGPRVKIAGEVARPAIYELRPGEALTDALHLAGGVTPYAALDAATIDRMLPPEHRPAPGYNRTVITVDLGEVMRGAAPPVPLLAADSITVFSVRGGRRGAVTVAGSVWQPGTYALAPKMRLWDLIELAGGLRPETYAGRAQVLRVRPDSTHQLLGFPLEPRDRAQPENNPPLREGDEVTIYATTDFRPAHFVTVGGAVNRPGRIAYADSMTLLDAVLMAGGLSEGAHLAQAELARLRKPGAPAGDSLVQILSVPLDSSYIAGGTGGVDGPGRAWAPTVLLQPYDQVFVRVTPGWELQRNVTLTGEVRFPGAYTLTQRDERLSSVLARAGGLTENAYADGIEFRRSRGRAGRLPVDLPRDDLVLEPGDSIHIPRFIPVVRVDGAVQFPASVTFRQGAGIDYYVNAAGGYTSRADKRRTYVLQPNGLIEKRGRPGAGAVIQVPQKDPSEGGPSLIVVLGALAPVVSAATTILVALIIR